MKYLMAVVLMMFSTVSMAQEIYCEGKIKATYIDANGNVYINGVWRNDWTKICNTNDPDVVMCSLWTSYVATAVQNQLTATLQYSASSGMTCQNIPTYGSAPKPNYVMIHNVAFRDT